MKIALDAMGGDFAPQQVVAEGLGALQADRPTHIAGTANRVMASMLPRRFFTAMTASMSARVRARLVGAGVSLDVSIGDVTTRLEG